MSEDRPTTSFGEPNTNPPTPKETPTSTTEFLPSIFETPKTKQGSFEALSRWTPQSVEKYTVFSTTGSHLPGTSDPFSDLTVSTPYQLPSSHRRLLSTGGIEAEIASHVNHYSPTSALPLPPVDPSHRLPSSPTAARPFPSPIETDCPDGLQPRLSKKVRRGSSSNNNHQTVTPPPSTRKNEIRLAPKPQTNSMQNEEFESEFVANAPQQQNILGNFASGPPIDMFGLPLQPTSTAPPLEDSQGFWDPGMSGMDIDFSIPLANAFNGTDHRSMGSLDWGKSDDMFQETGMESLKNMENSTQKRERLLAPKPPSMPNVDTSMTEAPVFAHSFHLSADDTFTPINPGGGVDPGLLLTRPPSSAMELAAFDPMAQPLFTNSLSSPQLPPPPMKESKRGQVRRSASSREIGKSKKDKRAPNTSPVKASSRPGLLRSASETRARKPTSRATALPNMAPPMVHAPAAPTHGSRAGGRISPLKNHQRLPSLSSIPEHSGPRRRASVRFTIDARGRARAETTLIIDEEQHTPTRRRRRGAGISHEWRSSDDDSSSTDDEPIVIPSRGSFSIPESRAPLYTRPFRPSQGSISNQSTSSLGIYYAEPNVSQGDAESDAETVTNMTAGNNNRGDAMSELRKVREDRQKRMPSLNTSHQSTSGALPSTRSIISPTSQSEIASTPSTDRGNQIRCVCNTTFSHINGDGYMVQCESCEMWLHGKCVKITRQTLPRVYICAFCANTPNSHGGRGRGMRRTVGPANPRVPAASPLSHKSIRSFR